MIISYLFFMICILAICTVTGLIVFIIVKNEEKKDEAKHQQNRKTIKFLKKYMEYERNKR